MDVCQYNIFTAIYLVLREAVYVICGFYLAGGVCMKGQVGFIEVQITCVPVYVVGFFFPPLPVRLKML